jgi:hypothetical protein
MSRSGYSEDLEQWDLIRWRGAVNSAIRGKRGQAFLREMLAAMDAMPEKRLIAHELAEPKYIEIGHWGLHEGPPLVCAIGSVGEARGIDMSEIDPEDRETVANVFGISPAMVAEIVYENDECGHWKETPEHRFARMRRWVASLIKDEGL